MHVPDELTRTWPPRQTPMLTVITVLNTLQVSRGD
jgi:hypothetical protein